MDPQADQEAAAAREDAVRHHRAYTESGEEVSIRTVTVEVTPDETAAIARGEMPPRIQAQIDRQYAEDAVIEEMEER